MILTETEIADIKKRADAATPGPWRGVRSDDNGQWLMGINMPQGKDLPDYPWISTDREPGSEWDNCEFIAHSRTDVHRLIESHEGLRAKLKIANTALEFLAFNEISGVKPELTARFIALRTVKRIRGEE